MSLAEYGIWSVEESFFWFVMLAVLVISLVAALYAAMADAVDADMETAENEALFDDLDHEIGKALVEKDHEMDEQRLAVKEETAWGSESPACNCD